MNHWLLYAMMDHWLSCYDGKKSRGPCWMVMMIDVKVDGVGGKDLIHPPLWEMHTLAKLQDTLLQVFWLLLAFFPQDYKSRKACLHPFWGHLQSTPKLLEHVSYRPPAVPAHPNPTPVQSWDVYKSIRATVHASNIHSRRGCFSKLWRGF